VNQDSLELKGIHQLLVYDDDDVSILGGSVHTIGQKTQTLIVASMEIGLEINGDKIIAWSILEIRKQEEITK
jgi:hypothetical protein